MLGARRARLELALRHHYAARREDATAEVMDDLVSAMVREDARVGGSRLRAMGTAAFVAAQVRYVPAWTWAAQMALVALMCWMAHEAGDAGMIKLVVGILSAMTVLVGVPTVQASKQHGVAELEYSCRRNAASVMVARLVILGCSSSLSVAFMVAATASSLEASVFDVALWACPPFFFSCAGSLMALRKAAPSAAVLLCGVWTFGCTVLLFAYACVTPNAYTQASLAVWAAAAAVALAWLAREVALTLRAVADGLDAFSPHLAKTYN